MRREIDRQPGPKEGTRGAVSADRPNTTELPTEAGMTGTHHPLSEDAWDVFAEDGDEAEPEYGDFWPDRDESDEV